ncbi:RNA-binding protein squid-like [Schistocerca nitens]|uniref:RNA-binding protein squid-like n=1 Tax=Schistocerca nitens TaxID=7011 RepID=UPI00211989A5|nr:RNA-binding protein squid-like [Schistocerca nitens]
MNYYTDYQGFMPPAANGIQSTGTAGIPGRDDDRKLFIGGLPRQITENEIKNYFSLFGDVDSVTIKIDPFTGQSRGFAFIVFVDPKTIDQLLSSEHYINSKKVDLKRIIKKSQHGKIFVGGLTADITDNDIKSYFSQYGTVVDVQTPYDKARNQRKGFCFVTFDSKNVVRELLKTPKQFIKGKEVDVKKVKVNQEGTVTAAGGRVFPANWVNQGYGTYVGSYPQDFGTNYSSTTYEGYDYSTDYTTAYEYPGGYVYDGFSGVQGTYPTAGKPRVGARQLQRPQPY